MSKDRNKDLLIEFLMFIEDFPQLPKELAYYVFMIDLIDSCETERAQKVITNFRKSWGGYSKKLMVLNRFSQMKYLLGFIESKESEAVIKDV